MYSKSSDNYVLVPKSAVKSDYVDSGTTAPVTASSTSSTTSSSVVSLPSPSTLSVSRFSRSKLKPQSLTVYLPWNPVFSTSVRKASVKLDPTADAEFQYLALLYDEFRYDKVKVYHFNSIGDTNQSQFFGVSVLSYDMNSDGATPADVAVLVRMQHKIYVAFCEPKPDILEAPCHSMSNASGQWPPWQKTSLATSYWPGAIYLASSGYSSSASHPLNLMIELTMSFRTKQ